MATFAPGIASTASIISGSDVLYSAEGLKSVFKDFNYSGDGLVKQLQTFKNHGVHVLGSFIFGLPSEGREAVLPRLDALAKLIA